MRIIETEVKQPFLLVLTETDGTVLNYRVEFPLSSVVEAEAATGKSLKDPFSWMALPLQFLPELLKAGLAKNHPDVTLDRVRGYCELLGPEPLLEVHEALCWNAWPKAMQRFAEKLGKGTSPNAPSGDAS